MYHCISLWKKPRLMATFKSYIGDHEFWVKLTEREYNDSNSQTLLYHDGEYWDYIMSQKTRLN